jgi:hypothetical protein
MPFYFLLGEKMTVLRNELEILNDKKGTMHLRSTYDVGTAMNLARDLSDAGGGRSSDSEGRMRVMGYIPPEMWNFDPWLITAKRARNHGDMGEYVKNVKKFFEVHPRFAVITPKKYF